MSSVLWMDLTAEELRGIAVSGGSISIGAMALIVVAVVTIVRARR